MSELPPINPTATANPLGGLVPLLGGGETADEGYYATVVSIEPLRIQLDATDAVADVTPISLVSRLIPGNRVYAVRKGRQLVVVGRIQPTSRSLSGVNLNTLLASGDYYVLGNADATTSLNYPVGLAGKLTVTSIADGFAEQVYRTWTTADGLTREFVRDYYAGSWRPWVERTVWTDWRAIPLSGSWTSMSGGQFGAPVFRVGGDVVEFAGAANGGTSSTAPAYVGVLPTYARPERDRLLTRTLGETGGGPDVRINTSGGIYVFASSYQNWVNFTHLSFRKSNSTGF